MDRTVAAHRGRVFYSNARLTVITGKRGDYSRNAFLEQRIPRLVRFPNLSEPVLSFFHLLSRLGFLWFFTSSSPRHSIPGFHRIIRRDE